MKYLVAIWCVLAATLAIPIDVEISTQKQDLTLPIKETAAPKDELVLPKETTDVPFKDIAEIHLQDDNLGNYKLHFKSKAIDREEEHRDDGSVVGSYEYNDPKGVPHKVIYVGAADKGFIANSADIPKPVPEGEELIEARSKHLAVVEAERVKYPNGVPEEEPVPLSEVLRKLVVPEILDLPEGSVPVEDKEVVVAKAELLAEYKRILEELSKAYTNYSQK